MGYFGGVSGGGVAKAGGQNTHVQFNDQGNFGGEAGLAYDKAAKTLSIGQCRIKTPVPGNESVVIGNNVDTDQGNNVLVGRNMSLMSGPRSNCVCLVNGGTPPIGQDAIIVGRPSIAGGAKSVHVGRLGGCSGANAASMGYDAQCTHEGAMALGHESRSTAPGRATFGSKSNTMEVEATSHVRAIGALTTRKTSEPLPAELANGEMAIWFDVAANTFRILAKDGAGNLKRMELALT